MKEVSEGSWVFLSHSLCDSTPAFGGKNDFKSSKQKSLEEGDSSNSMVWSFSNHLGTHVDCPRHFFQDGLAVDEYPADFWCAKSPYLVDYAAQPGELIGLEAQRHWIPREADFLLIRTGFELHRRDTLYWESNPGLSSELGRWLRNERPWIRFVGFDFLSLTSFIHREVGRWAHREFLNPEHPILLVEDMSLQVVKTEVLRVWISPLRVSGADGSPVTVFAQLRLQNLKDLS